MKSTTGSKTEPLVSGQIPVRHEPIAIEDGADYVIWLEMRLNSLESQFAGFGTRSSKIASIAKNRST